MDDKSNDHLILEIIGYWEEQKSYRYQRNKHSVRFGKTVDPTFDYN